MARSANESFRHGNITPNDGGYPCPPLERFPRSLIRRIEKPDLPLSALGAVRELRAYLDTVERECIVKARTLGASPTEIAHALGITRQAVHKKLNALLKLNEPTIVLPEVDVDRTDA